MAKAKVKVGKKRLWRLEWQAAQWLETVEVAESLFPGEFKRCDSASVRTADVLIYLFLQLRERWPIGIHSNTNQYRIFDGPMPTTKAVPVVDTEHEPMPNSEEPCLNSLEVNGKLMVGFSCTKHVGHRGPCVWRGGNGQTQI